ncbi:MAG: hypothetical protein QM820_26935 [Minicystis sp.]
MGIVILLAWVGLSLAFVLDQLHRNPPGDAVWIGPLVMAIFFVPFGAGFAVKGYQGRILRVDLHEGGVAYQDNKGRLAFRWDEVAAVLWEQTAYVGDVGLGLEVTTRRLAKTTLHATGGKSIVVDERFPDHVKLAAQIRDAAAEAMLPHFEGALSAGRRVFFGHVGIDTWGLHLREAIPWSAVAGIRWEPDGASARYVIYGTSGARIGEIRCPVPNEVILQVVLSRLGKLGNSLEEGAPLGDELLAAARGLLARHLPR